MSPTPHIHADANEITTKQGYSFKKDELWVFQRREGEHTNEVVAIGRAAAAQLGKTLRVIPQDEIIGSDFKYYHYKESRTSPIYEQMLGNALRYMKANGVPSVIISDNSVRADRNFPLATNIILAEEIGKRTGIEPFCCQNSAALIQSTLPISAISTEEMRALQQRVITHQESTTTPHWGTLKRPVIVMSYVDQMQSIDLHSLIAPLSSLAAHASILITDSPRTAGQAEHLKQFLEQHIPGIHIAAAYSFQKNDPKNPYKPMLAAADMHIAIGESTSMASDMALTGKPVYCADAGEAERYNYLEQQITKDRSPHTPRFMPLADMSHWQQHASQITPLDVSHLSAHEQVVEPYQQHQLTSRHLKAGAVNGIT